MKRIFGKITKTCKTCGEQFFIHRYREETAKFCSDKCRSDSRKGIIPKRSFKKGSSPWNKGKRGVQIVSEETKKKMSTSIKIAYQNPKLRKKLREIRTGNSYLTKFWENPPQDFIDRLRERAVERRKNPGSKKETKPERLFRQELERRSIVFESQFGFEGLFVADFFIPRLQAFIFCDGTYWHSLISSEEKDLQQIMYVKSKGMKAYRFDEKEIYNDVSKCLDLVLEDAEQPFNFAEVIDKFIVLDIKKRYASDDKLKQVLADYRRMKRIVISSLDYYHVNDAEKIYNLLIELFSVNREIFILVGKIQKNKHDKNDAKKVQDLNLYRNKVKNVLNEEFSERQEVKI